MGRNPNPNPRNPETPPQRTRNPERGEKEPYLPFGPERASPSRRCTHHRVVPRSCPFWHRGKAAQRRRAHRKGSEHASEWSHSDAQHRLALLSHPCARRRRGRSTKGEREENDGWRRRNGLGFAPGRSFHLLYFGTGVPWPSDHRERLRWRRGGAAPALGRFGSPGPGCGLGTAPVRRTAACAGWAESWRLESLDYPPRTVQNRKEVFFFRNYFIHFLMHRKFQKL